MIKYKRNPKYIEIYSSGSLDDANVLLDIAQKIGRQIGFDRDDINLILDEMKSGDHENLVQIFNDHFEDYFCNCVVIYR